MNGYLWVYVIYMISLTQSLSAILNFSYIMHNIKKKGHPDMKVVRVLASTLLSLTTALREICISDFCVGGSFCIRGLCFNLGVDLGYWFQALQKTGCAFWMGLLKKNS